MIEKLFYDENFRGTGLDRIFFNKICQNFRISLIDFAKIFCRDFCQKFLSRLGQFPENFRKKKKFLNSFNYFFLFFEKFVKNPRFSFFLFQLFRRLSSMEGLNDLVEEQLLSMSNHLIKMAR